MTDAELASYLNLTPAEAARLIPKMSTELRATFDRMKQVETEASLWVKGEGPKPQGVLIDLPRNKRTNERRCRERTNVCDPVAGECMRCHAAQGEACREPTAPPGKVSPPSVL